MKEKIIDIIGISGLKITIKTFHSFCFDIIKTESKKNTDIHFDFIIFDEEDCKELLNEFNPDKYPIKSLQK